MIRAAIVGASGYIGGELLRILLGHPEVTVTQVTSERMAGRLASSAHPNLRGRTQLRFRRAEELGDCDALFFTTPHRLTMGLLPGLAARAGLVIDLSADFRLDVDAYQRYYGTPHAAPELLTEFTVGCPELARDRLRQADRVSVPGCTATAAILALLPLARSGLTAADVQVDARTGSSGAGRGDGAAGAHAERSGAMRVFAPVTHRHEAEIARHTGLEVRMSATGTPATRGAQVICHARARCPVSEHDLRRAYRQQYASEPFVRIIAERRGIHRLPDPKTLLGSNYCDVGFAVDGDGTRVAAIAALDNLVKGGAGAAVQCLNIRMGWPEQFGLDFPGLHPV
jgi:N-acetyl-gamma-glutamyl-phosphate/LysW-gamma-L-alpha-aminoadipyl-6-phosphate reductase